MIELEDVRKTFDVRIKRGLLRRERRRVEAVAGVTLSIGRGEMVGYVAPFGPT